MFMKNIRNLFSRFGNFTLNFRQQKYTGINFQEKSIRIFVYGQIILIVAILSYRIFFQECDYDLKIAKSRETERLFFKKVRNIIYEIGMAIFTNSPNQYVQYFCATFRILIKVIFNSRVNLENNYQAIALTLVEIPCGYTASCYVTVAMSLQEFAFKTSKEDLVRSNHLHAIVVSMMTLICHIHNAEVKSNL